MFQSAKTHIFALFCCCSSRHTDPRALWRWWLMSLTRVRKEKNVSNCITCDSQVTQLISLTKHRPCTCTLRAFHLLPDSQCSICHLVYCCSRWLHTISTLISIHFFLFRFASDKTDARPHTRAPWVNYQFKSQFVGENEKSKWMNTLSPPTAYTNLWSHLLPSLFSLCLLLCLFLSLPLYFFSLPVTAIKLCLGKILQWKCH